MIIQGQEPPSRIRITTPATILVYLHKNQGSNNQSERGLSGSLADTTTANYARSSGPYFPVRTPSIDRSEISNFGTFSSFCYTVKQRNTHTPDVNQTALLKFQHKVAAKQYRREKQNKHVICRPWLDPHWESCARGLIIVSLETISMAKSRPRQKHLSYNPVEFTRERDEKQSDPAKRRLMKRCQEMLTLQSGS